MTAPKPGDRVRVEYEAEYHTTAGDDHLVDVVHQGHDNYTVFVPAGAKLTVLPKPLRVGDKVRLGEDPEPPVGTVLLYPITGEALRRCESGWTYATRSTSAFEWAAHLSRVEATVVWLPGGAS